ncbi:MAG: peptide chain release factor 2 [Candidatus Spechtbacteria bacterium SB0662_bin_43]|uniref:Peptide chain release factor 2 n=1 Tax=Candidatus Spechtbacteria bacterium SB0662_bin_43 TaxID=2604897 RepID=A0A845D9H4_9BACT|nr:peptide chain release factor 2 [Candidatus Spechtbacteria bacterium SB0662_bin_43]
MICVRKSSRLRTVFDIPGLQQQLDELRQESHSELFWKNPERAVAVQKKIAFLEEEIAVWKRFLDTIDGITDEVAQHDSGTEDTINTLEKRVSVLEKEYLKQEYRIFLSGEYDQRNAYLSLYSGAGGSDAADWTRMLLRMYQRYCERQGWDISLIAESSAEGGGMKEATLFVQHPYAYGLLKGEHGVHRLVRLSPFSSAKLRHTSFALVDIIPEIEKTQNVVLSKDTIRVDFFRSSGPGGQNTNKRETAVRVTHIPTGISATSQKERSQAANREQAYKLLYSKVYIRTMKQKEEDAAGIKGDAVAVEWGSQIRSYTLHPYQLVKDHRTNTTTQDTGAVLDGDIDIFIQSFTKQSF